MQTWFACMIPAGAGRQRLQEGTQGEVLDHRRAASIGGDGGTPTDAIELNPKFSSTTDLSLVDHTKTYHILLCLNAS